ncbi:MAG TPA: inorganic pyrophosphatase [Pyrinomonadaceae bacterium]|nr:inorganic pyrophosphatase [Chloracidobacterium sp.]MBP9936589.1 inorganic pyrophosphatase [Pyrinomonadaceae bacterium]MBK7803671.1 inorganic pyrophosphatase [Chloracidobacterium sp.]MBL0239073.1 inorganic pyrophosphatase [Chloracidobacterium sp.]HQX57301.1 inorganic pyrophosphatase [Pyrinomonadaceae bacterium]
MFRTNKAHPWHGIPIGDNAPQEVSVFIEIVPRDTVKYEVDKETGYLKIDRPQQYSNVVPANYGFIPRTYCGEGIANLARSGTSISITGGDHDPLDILVLSEHHIPRGDIILKAIPIGGFCLIDGGEADDKIIAVLKGDKVFEQYTEIHELPKGILERFEHYFLTYKSLPDAPNICEIAYSYGKEDARRVIEMAIADYAELLKDDEK